MEFCEGPVSVDLGNARALADQAARHWGRTLAPKFEMAAVSYVAPAGAEVIKVAYDGDTEALHEREALRLWNGDRAVRLLDS